MSSAGWYFIYATKLHDHDHHNHHIVQVVGVRTQQRLLLLPWQLYHATLVLACVGGGFYQVIEPPPSQYHLDAQALHFTVLAEKKDTLRACLALFPVVAGIFFTFLWVADHDADHGDNHGQPSQTIIMNHDIIEQIQSQVLINDSNNKNSIQGARPPAGAETSISTTT